jgi:tRNA-Thr(GGU) m(6)t(6)A37 methyltransferase TsaA
LQGDEGGAVARIAIDAAFWSALEGLQEGDELLLLTWLHRARRDVLQVHPRGDERRPLTGVFATRSPDRPNPLGLHRVQLLRRLAPGLLEVSPLEAIDGTPLVDVKPVLSPDDR